ncbi:interferon lambda receptor 1 isoform X2 [Malaclemys terrapin pileata]|uniref:interferon lambda receptor 1 isoform X2 n=1 Tax=Malaclemys terrapin pileata TaxID=2991368 RepID=UPI0023A8B429|nr:interferon lambda receptor 1 isoform X2 [Malaclemys terrapin pileata]
MSAGRIGILVALSSLQQILGSVALGQPTVRLSPPRNVTLLSKDFGMALTWLPGEGAPPDVLYTVRYRKWTQVKRWKKVQHCRNISQTTCNLTCVKDLYNKVSARVKALSAGRQSPWVESGFMEYYFDVELAPPALEVSVSESTINVGAAFPLASCVESTFIDLKYDLDFWEAGTEDKIQYCDNMKWDQITINTREISGNYCLSARASFQVIKLKHSEFSKPVCVLFKSKAVDWKFLVTIAVPLLVLLFLCAAAPSILCLCKQAAKRVKRPQALDFSHFRAPGMILEKEPSKKEFFEEDLLACMEKPELGGRRSGPSVRNNVSLNASLPSLWEEEEEDDSSSFRPYTEMPRFLKRAPNCQVASTSHQGTQSGSELGGSHLDGGSVSDLAGLGFSQPVWRRGSAKEDTSGFQDSEKSFLSESSSLGDFSLIEARYPATNGHGQLVCQEDTFLQMTVLTEGLNGKPPDYEQRLQMRHPHNTNHQWHPYPDPIVCVALEVSQDSDGFPLEGQLVCFQTLKLAEDEGIASNSDSLTVCSEEDPPSLASLVGETFEAETRGKGGSLQQESDPIFKFQGYQHVRYMPRN